MINTLQPPMSSRDREALADYLEVAILHMRRLTRRRSPAVPPALIDRLLLLASDAEQLRDRVIAGAEVYPNLLSTV